MDTILKDAGLGQQGTFTLLQHKGRMYIVYRINAGYTLFKVEGDQELSVQINNDIADLYEQGEHEAKLKKERECATKTFGL